MRTVVRAAMYDALSGYFAEHPESGIGRALSVGRSSNLIGLVTRGSVEVVDVDYPKHDLLSLPFDDEAFDLFVADQVLEHVAGDPFVAMRESFRVVRSGGVVLHTTCFANAIHGEVDMWRFTPDALALLCREHEVLMAGGWGNRAIAWLDHFHLLYRELPRQWWRPLNLVARANHPKWPVVTWVVARRRGYPYLPETTR